MTDGETAIAKALQAEVAKLKLENSRLKEEAAPTEPYMPTQYTDYVHYDLERRKLERKLAMVTEGLSRQNQELEHILKAVEDDATRMRLGKKLVKLIVMSEERAKSLGHRAVGTADLLWAMFHDDEEKNNPSIALQILNKRGVTKESVYASHKYSDNATEILKLAGEHAAHEVKPLVGTEDLLWAMFQPGKHVHSRSNAISHLLNRGINMDLVWGNAVLSENAKEALKLAVAQAIKEKRTVIGSEHLMESLFTQSGDGTGARFWLSQHALRGGKQRGNYQDDMHGSDLLEESILRMFVVGGLAGVIETTCLQPFVYWKTMQQIRGRFSFDPTVMYRGVGVNAGSIGPISAVQYASNGLCVSLHHNLTERNMTNAESLVIAAATGGASSVVVSPAELLMISQQRTGHTFVHTARHILVRPMVGQVLDSVTSTYNWKGLYRGVTATMIREAGWTFGFLGLAPKIKAGLRDDSKFFHNSDVAASLAASLIAGQVAAILTQPADTIKTMIQSDRGIDRPMKYVSTFKVCQDLYQTSGVTAFWRGLAPRSLRCMGAVFILGEAQERLSWLFDHFNILPGQP